MQIEDQGEKQHGRRRIPKGIVGFAVLWRGALEQVGHKPLYIVVVPEIHEGVVAMAALHIQEIQHP